MNGRPRITVMGGGLAGIAACERLSRNPDRSFDILLLEGRPHLGGRVGSYFDPAIGREIDTGQHLFLSCYTGTLALLEALGTLPGLVFYDRLYLPLWDPERGLNPLDLPGSDNPLALAGGLLQYEGLPFTSRLAFLRLSRAIPKNDNDVDHLSAYEFLRRAGQPESVIDRFWELVILSATNLPSRKVSAAILVRILKESLLKGGSHSRPAYNAVPLSELFVLPAMKLFRNRGVTVRTKTRIVGFSAEQGRVIGVSTAQEELPLGRSDHLLSALPPWAFEKIAPISLHQAPLVDQMSRLAYSSPILSVNLLFSEPVDLPLITGFPQSTVHWIFNRDAMEQRLTPETRPWFDWSTRIEDDMHPTRVASATVSGADDLMGLSDEDLGALCLEHVRKIDPKSRATLKSVRAVRDRFATPVLPAGQGSLRPEARTSIPNLWMAGDITDTGLPATMEGAVRSGYRAAELILEALGEK